MDDSREILYNDAALNCLKRHQLQSLTRKHGLKSNGKNTDLIQRLQDFAVTLTPGRPMYLPYPAQTPAPGDASSTCSEVSSPSLPQPVPATHDANTRQTKTSSTSGNWEMLSDSGASFVSPSKAAKQDTMDIIRSWKSSRNGEKMDDFGGPSDRIVSSGSMNSIKSMASSLKRSASQHLLPRSRRNSINMLAEQPAPHAEETSIADDEPMEHMIDPPSPASTVGVPRRYSGLSLLERPSTVRLVASPPPTEHEDERDQAGDLPFLGSAKKIHSLKERRSMAPLPSATSIAAAPAVPLARKSMPAISAAGSASVSNIYPPLPQLPIEFQKLRDAPAPTAMPGAMPTSPKKPGTFVFGGDEGGPSNQDFSDAGKAILAQLNAKLPSGFTFSEEHLKGKQAGLDRLVRTNSTLGEGGWGLGSMGGPKVDRYADAHQKEFAKMRSISKQNLPTLSRSTTTVKSKGSTTTLDAGSTPAKRKRSSTPMPSAPNGAPLITESTDKAPEPKKKRMSYLGGLKEAGKSLLNLRDDATPLEQAVAANQEKRRQSRRRSSLLPGALKNRFGWLGRKKKNLGPAIASRQAQPAQIPAPTLPRKTSVYAPRNMPPPKPAFDLQASLRRSTTTTSRNLASSTSSYYGPKQRKASSSAQTVMSTASSRARSKIPDFGPMGSNSAAASSVNTLGLPKPSSSMSSSMRKQSQADILKNARPAPPPPSETARPKFTASVTSSRLYAPTASSLARMQATIKPEGPKPMPAKSSLTSTSTEPFGLGSTRDVLFQTNFNVPKPAGPRPQGIQKTKSISQLKSPIKSAASARARAQASGINAVKSRPDMRKEREVHARKAEIKARQDRMGEERELRKLLASDDDVFIPDA